jgi:hypothetical protein
MHWTFVDAEGPGGEGDDDVKGGAKGRRKK